MQNKRLLQDFQHLVDFYHENKVDSLKYSILKFADLLSKDSPNYIKSELKGIFNKDIIEFLLNDHHKGLTIEGFLSLFEEIMVIKKGSVNEIEMAGLFFACYKLSKLYPGCYQLTDAKNYLKDFVNQHLINNNKKDQLDVKS